MDPNWLKDQRIRYDKKREHFKELLKQHRNDALALITAFNQNDQERAQEEQNLRKAIATSKTPEEKVKLYYQLLTTINLRRENADLLATIEKYKNNLPSNDFDKAVEVEQKYFTELAHLFDRKMHELHQAYLKKSQHLALLAINPASSLAQQKSNAEDMHTAYLSMHELTKISLFKEYNEISSALAEENQQAYAIYHNLAEHCAAVIAAADQRKLNQHVTLTGKNSVSPPSTFHLPKENPMSVLLKDRAVLAEMRDKVRKELTELKSQLSSGKLDNAKLGYLQFEHDLIEHAFKQIARTQEIINSSLTSAEFLRQRKPEISHGVSLNNPKRID